MENKIPVQIEIRPPSQGDVTRAMSSIEAAATAQGRKVGDSFSRASKPDDSHVKAYLKDIERFYRDWDRAIFEDRKRTLDRIAVVEKAHTQAIIENAKREADAVRAARQAAYANSSQAVYESAGIKGPGDRRSDAAAVRAAQKQMFDDLKAGNVTLGQYNTLMDDAAKKLNLIETGNVRARGAVHQFIAKMASFTFELTGAIYGMGVLAATLGSPMLFGVSFLRKLEDSKMGIASILLSMGSINGQTLTWTQSMGAANAQMDAMAKESINLSGKLDEFASAYRAILAPGLAAGMNLEQIRKIAVAGTVAVKTIGLDSRQIVQEIRDLVAGGIQASSSTLATSLGLTDRDIKAAKMSSEGLFAFLEKRLAGFVEGATHRTETLSGRMEQVGEIITQALGEASKGAFQTLKRLFDDIANAIAVIDKKGQFVAFKPEFIATLKGYLAVLDQVLSAVGRLVKFMWDIKEILLSYLAINASVKIWGAMSKALEVYNAALVANIALERARASVTGLQGKTSFAVAPANVQQALMLGSGGVEAAGALATTSIASVAKSALRLVGWGGIIGILLWGTMKAWGWWKDYLDGPINDTEEAAKRISEIQKKVRLDEQIKPLQAAMANIQKIISTPGLSDSAKAVYVKKLEEFQIQIDKLNGKAGETTDTISRMDSELLNAKRSMDALNGSYSKAYDEAGRMGDAFMALSRVREAYVKFQSAPKYGMTAAEVDKKSREYEMEVKKLNMAMEAEKTLSRLRADVAKATTSEGKRQAELEVTKTEQLLPLKFAELRIREDLGIAIKAQNKEYEAYYKHLLNLNLAEQEAIRNQKVVNSEKVKYVKIMEDAKKIADDYVKSQRDAIKGIDLDKRLVGKNELERKLLTEQITYENELRRLRRNYNDQIKSGRDPNQANAEMAANLSDMTSAYNDHIAAIKELDALTSSWSYGAQSAFKTYSDAATNSAEHAKRVWTTAFTGMENALTTFVKTGKLDFRDLTNSIIDDLIRIQIQKTVTGFAGMIFGSYATASYYGTNTGSTQTSMLASQDAGIGNWGTKSRSLQRPTNQPSSGDTINVTVNVSPNGSSSVDTNKASPNAKDLGYAISQAVQAEILKQQRPGGLLAKN